MLQVLYLFIWMKTPSFKNGEHEANGECDESDECFTALWDETLLLCKDDVFLRKGHHPPINNEGIWPLVLRQNLLDIAGDFDLRLHERFHCATHSSSYEG